MMFKKNYVIRLELNGVLINEISSSDISGEIVIGRGADCTWKIPIADRGASSQHAKLYRKGWQFYIQDLKSRNGIYFMGEKIQLRKLSGGDIYSIGDCKLIVEDAAPHIAHTKSRVAFHRLEQLTGKDRGKIYHLREDNIKIGAASGCGIVLDDSLVSHIHAVLENHNDGTCWLKDMGSRNGTKVNGTPLTVENAETGRMLKDGDIVSIAYLDFRFWDKAVTHIRSHLLLKIGVVAVTLALVIGAYFAYQTISPSAKSIRLNAEKYAAEEQFDEAREILQRAVTARGADTDAVQRLELLQKLDVWEKTVSDWKTVQQLLSGTNWENDLYTANDLLSALVTADRGYWQWNTEKAAKELKKAQETHVLLTLVLRVEEHLRQDEEDNMDYLKRAAVDMEESIRICKNNSFKFRRGLLIKAEDLISEIQTHSREYEAVNNTMAQYKSVSDTEKIIAELQLLKKQVDERTQGRSEKRLATSRSISIYCEKLLLPLQGLQRSKKCLEQNYKKIAEMQFDQFIKDLKLPTSNECMISANLATRRADMERNNKSLERIIIQLKNFEFLFQQNDIVPGRNSAAMDEIFADSTWETIMNFDCFKKSPPAYSAKKPESVYDRILGVYIFWEYIRSIGIEFDTNIFDESFKPEIFKAMDTFRMLETFKSFCDPNANIPGVADIQKLLSENTEQNQLKKYLATTEMILLKRDQLANRLYRLYLQNKNNRKGIVAGAAALYLATNRSEFKENELAAELQKSSVALRLKISDMIDSLVDSTPEQIIIIQKQLLKTGLPGDSRLKDAWSKYYGDE